MRIDNQRLSLQEHQINVDLFLNTISVSFINQLNQPIPLFPHHSRTSISYAYYILYVCFHTWFIFDLI